MKQDSYARFLKSDLYKSWLMKEMEGQPLELTPEDSVTDKEKLLDKVLEKDTKKKGKGKENEDHKEKRRRSLLPWRQSKLDTKLSCVIQMVLHLYHTILALNNFENKAF